MSDRIQEMSSLLLQVDRNRGVGCDGARGDPAIHRHDFDTCRCCLTQCSTESGMGDIVGFERGDLFHLYDKENKTFKLPGY